MSSTISQNQDFLISYQRNLLKNLHNSVNTITTSNNTQAAVAAMAAAYGNNYYLTHQQTPIPIIGYDFINPGFIDPKHNHIPVTNSLDTFYFP